MFRVRLAVASKASIPKVRRWYQFLPVTRTASPSEETSELLVGLRVFPDVGAVTDSKFVCSGSTPRPPQPARTLTTPQLDTLTNALECFVRLQSVPSEWSSLHPAQTLYALVPGGQKRICSDSGKVR